MPNNVGTQIHTCPSIPHAVEETIYMSFSITSWLLSVLSRLKQVMSYTTA